jgi:hypothetical protein
MYRFLLSLSSFSAGGILYLFTNPLNLSLEYYWLIVLVAFFIFLFGALGLESCYRNFYQGENDTLIVQEVQPMEQDIIPIYIGLFVIMLNIGDLSIDLQILLILVLFTIWWKLLEQSYYFNIFWLTKYRLYKVKDSEGNIYSIYTKRKDLKLTRVKSEENFNLVRINNFSFIEIEE